MSLPTFPWRRRLAPLLALCAVAVIALTVAVTIGPRPWLGTRTAAPAGLPSSAAPSPVAPDGSPTAAPPPAVSSGPSSGLSSPAAVREPDAASRLSARRSPSARPSPPATPSAQASPVVDPASYPWPATDGWVADGHGYYVGECTSFAAWAVRASGRPSPDWLGNANMWHSANTSAEPHAGDVAQWDPNYHDAGSAGHVAFVAAVNGRTITIYEYNNTAPGAGGFHRLTIRTVKLDDEPGTRSLYPSRYLRF